MALDYSLDLTVPDGRSSPRNGDDAIRDFKQSFVEIAGNDHYVPVSTNVVSDDASGEHTKVTLRQMDTAPTEVADKGFVYTKEYTNTSSETSTELYYKNSDGEEKQITAEGKLNLTSSEMNTYCPVGYVAMFAGSTAPTGWLLCYGQTLTQGGSGQTYEALYNVIGITYGGTGSSSFKVPDFRGRTIIGKDNMGGTSANRVTATAADTLGGSGGEETHLLLDEESGVPAHKHAEAIYVGDDQADVLFSDSNGVVDRGTVKRIEGSSNSYASCSPYTANNTPANATAAHNNMQPYIAMNYIIKY